MADIKFPFGNADVQIVAVSATPSVTITDTLTILRQSPTAAVTAFDITAEAGLTVGSMVKVDIIQDATGRNVTFGSGGDTIIAPVLTGVASDRDSIWITWDGTEWTGGVWEKYFDAA